MSSTVVIPGQDPKEETKMGGRKTRGATTKQLKKMLKKAGLKTTGKKAALTRRAKKAHLKMRGGEVKVGSEEAVIKGGGLTPHPYGPGQEGGRRRKSRRSRGFKLF
jgi:hypothetical protein